LVEDEQPQAAQTALQIDPVLQTVANLPLNTIPGLNFDGVGIGFTGPQGTFPGRGPPPDANGAAGTFQYVQWMR
jgi:hypothetical protein